MSDIFERAGVPRRNAELRPAPDRKAHDVDAEGRPVVKNPFKRIGQEIVNPPGEGSFIERAGAGVARGVKGLLNIPRDIIESIPPPGPGDSPQAHENFFNRQRAAEARVSQETPDPSEGTDFYEALGGELPFALGGFGAGAARARLLPKGIGRRAVKGVIAKGGEQFVRSKRRLAAEELASALGSSLGQTAFEGAGAEVAASIAGGLLAPGFVPRGVGRSTPPGVPGFSRSEVRAAQDVIADASGDLPTAAATTNQTPAGGSVFASVGERGVGDVGLRRLQSELAGKEPEFAQRLASQKRAGIARTASEVQSSVGPGRLADTQRELGKQQAGIDLADETDHTARVAEYRSQVERARESAATAMEQSGIRSGSDTASQTLQTALLQASDETLKPIGAKFDELATRADEAGVRLDTTPLVAALGKVAESSDWNQVLESLPPTMRKKVESTIRFRQGKPVLDESGDFPRWVRPTEPEPISWTELRALQQRVGLVKRGTKEPVILHDLGLIEQGIKDSFDTAGGEWRPQLDAIRREYAEASGIFRSGQLDSVLQPNARLREPGEDTVAAVWRSDRNKGATSEARRLRSAIQRKPELMETVEQAVLAQAYDAAVNPVTRLVEADRLARWVGTHQRALGVFPEIAEKINHPLKAQRAFEALREAGEPNRLAAQRTALSEFVENPEATIARIVRQKDGAALGDLIRRTRDNPDAFAGLRRTLFDQSVGEVEEVLTSSRLRSALSENRALLRQAFGDDHVKNLDLKADEMERFEAITRRGPDVSIETERTRGPLRRLLNPFMERLGGIRWKVRRETEVLQELSAQFTDSRVRQLLIQMDTDPQLAKLMMSTATPANQRALVRYLTVTGLLSAGAQATRGTTAAIESFSQGEPNEKATAR